MHIVNCSIYGSGVLSGVSGIKVHVYFSRLGNYAVYNKAGQPIDIERANRTLTDDGEIQRGFWEGGEQVNITFVKGDKPHILNATVAHQIGDMLTLLKQNGELETVNVVEVTISEVSGTHFTLKENEIVTIDGRDYAFHQSTPNNPNGDTFYDFLNRAYVTIWAKDGNGNQRNVIRSGYFFYNCEGDVVELTDREGQQHYGRVVNETPTHIYLKQSSKMPTITFQRKDIQNVESLCYERD